MKQALSLLAILFITIQALSQEDNSTTTPQPLSGIDQSYIKVVVKYHKMPKSNWALISGIWIPFGELKIMGNHPQIGFQFGVKHRKMNYDLSFIFTTEESRDYFYVKRPSGDNMELSHRFFGGYLGLDIGRDILCINAHELQLNGGIALEGIDVLEENKNKNLPPAFVWSYNFNIGLGYRYYFANSMYLGIKLKYNVVDYTLNKVIDYNGNTFTLHFMIGGLNKIFNNKKLKSIRI
jgi:hypothetical protein